MTRIRNKEETKKRLIDAVGTLISKQGFQDLGINSIAREAGVDKVLIYRYFKDIDGLLNDFLKERDYWMKTESLLKTDLKTEDVDFMRALLKELLINQLHELYKNREMQEFMKWELIESNRITRKAAEGREKAGSALLKKFTETLNENTLDLAAISSILFAGIYYLVLRSGTVSVFNTIPLDNDNGWKRIENATMQIVDLLFEKMEQ